MSDDCVRCGYPVINCICGYLEETYTREIDPMDKDDADVELEDDIEKELDFSMYCYPLHSVHL